MLGYLEEIAYRDTCYMNKQVLRILEIWNFYSKNNFKILTCCGKSFEMEKKKKKWS